MEELDRKSGYFCIWGLELAGCHACLGVGNADEYPVRNFPHKAHCPQAAAERTNVPEDVQ